MNHKLINDFPVLLHCFDNPALLRAYLTCLVLTGAVLPENNSLERSSKPLLTGAVGQKIGLIVSPAMSHLLLQAL